MYWLYQVRLLSYNSVYTEKLLLRGYKVATENSMEYTLSLYIAGNMLKIFFIWMYSNSTLVP